MKRNHCLTAGVALGAALGVLGPTPSAAQPSATAQRGQAEPGALSRPESHRVLEGLVGHWRLEATQFVPGRPPVKVTGTSDNTWILGGRFVQFGSTTGEGSGRVDSLTTFGFDPRSAQYFAAVVTTSEMPYLVLRGPYYEASRSFVLRGDDISSVGVRFKRRYLIRFEGKDRFVVESFSEYLGANPVMVGEVVYTRG